VVDRTNDTYICVCFFVPFRLVEAFLFRRKTTSAYVEKYIQELTINDTYICIYFFFPFLLDIYDFVWGQAFLHKTEPFPHRLVLLSTAVLDRREFLNRQEMTFSRLMNSHDNSKNSNIFY